MGSMEEPAVVSRPSPLFSYTLAGLCLFVFTVQLLMMTDERLGLPLYANGVSFWRGEYWGLLTSFFLHLTPLHLALNLFCFLRLARDLERSLGTAYFILFWFVGTALSSLAELTFTGDAGVGADGFIYAIFAFRLFSRPIWQNAQEEDDDDDEPEDSEGLAMDTETIGMFIVWSFICVSLSLVGVNPLFIFTDLGGFLVGALCAYGFMVREGDVWGRASTCLLLLFCFIPCFYAPWTSCWNFAEGESAFQNGRYAEASEILQKVDVRELAGECLEMRSVSLLHLGRFPEALALLKTLLFEMKPSDLPDLAEVQNTYAYVLATAPDDKLRNSQEALRYAKLAVIGHEKEAAILDTVAAAYAAVGDFDQALDWEQKALAMNPTQPDLDQLKGHLALFQQHKTVIDPGTESP